MTTETPAPASTPGSGACRGEDDWKDCRPQRPPEEGCDPAYVDELKCKASGIKAQADYNATYEAPLEQAQKDYDATRKAYRTARHDAALAVQDMKHQIKHLIERIRCLIEQDRVVRCLDEAYGEVAGWLDCCEGDPGCCVGDCEYDDSTDLTYSKLVKRIAKYQKQADAAQACFTTLVGEPEALKKRVTAAQAEIDKVNTALAEDPAKTDLKRVYAQARIAQRLVTRVWNGFDDVNAFVECLCRALTCWTHGTAVVSVLTGEKAVQDCRRTSATDWCATLVSGPVDEILAEYDRLCPSQKPCSSPSEPCDDDEEPETPPDKGDCGCGHHHHHHHHDCGCSDGDDGHGGSDDGNGNGSNGNGNGGNGDGSPPVG